MYCESNTDGTVGGSFFSLLYLVSGLDRKKYRPIVVFHKEHALLPKYQEAGVDTMVIDRPVPFNLNKPDNKLLGLFFPLMKIFQKSVNFIKFLPMTSVRYAYFMRKNNIKLLHLNNSIVKNNDWMLGARMIGVKCITHERGINRFYPRMARYFAPRLDGIICISNAVRKVLTDNGIPSENLVTIYNGIDPNIVKISRSADQVRAQHGTHPSRIIIGVIGNIKEWKGQEVAVRAMPAILEKYPDVVCYLVGDTSADDQYYKDHLLALIATLGIQDHIVFTGYTTNVADYLNVMQLVLHTSVAPEPFGRVLIEAMSMKKPLIGSRAGAVPEIIEEGISGYTFASGDHKQLSDRVLKILDNPDLAQSMSENGYKIVSEKFNIARNIQATQDLYQRILAGSVQ